MKRRILLAFATLLFIFLLGSVMAAVHVITATKELEKIMSLHQVDTLRQALENSIRTVQVDLYSVNTPISRSIDKVIENVEIMETRAAQCQSCHHREELTRRFVHLDQDIDHFKELLSNFLTSSSNNARVEKIGKETARMGGELMGEVEELSLLTSGRFHRLTDRAINRINYVAAILMITLAATMFVGLLISGYLFKELMGPLTSLIEGTRKLRAGELGYEMPQSGPPEFREVAKNFNEMSGALRVAYKNLEETNEELSREISERNKAQAERDSLMEQLLHARKMEAVGTLSGGIAHEFNNLLQVISGSAELLAYKTDESDPRRKQIETIVNTSRRGADLTRRLLAFSRKVEGDLKPLDVNARLSRMPEILAPTLPKNIEIVLDLCAEAVVISADSGGFEQIVLNLAINARDAMPEGGRLIFRTHTEPREATPLFDSKDDWKEAVVIEVSDTGHGIDEKTLPNIFDPFFTTKEVGSGTGLGLSVTYGMVKAYGGEIVCASEVGKGTTFTIYFPGREGLSQPDAFLKDEVRMEQVSSARTVLLADVETGILETAGELLKRSGYTVLFAESAAEALEKSAQAHLAVVSPLLDAANGAAFIREIRARQKNPRVIVWTSLSLEGEEGGAINSQADAILHKPFKLADLLREVSALAES